MRSACIHSTDGNDIATRGSIAEDKPLHVRPQTQAGTSTLAGPGQTLSDRQPRKRGDQRRRRSPGDRFDSVSDRATVNPPHPPRPKRGARSSQTRAVASSGNTAERPRARAGADTNSSTGGGTGAKEHAGVISRSANSQKHEKNQDPAVARFGEARLEISPVLSLSLKEGEGEEHFPALPPTSRHRQTMEQPPPRSPAAATELVRLDYSSLAEKLAAGAGRTVVAAASSPGAANSTVGDGFSRLSILPNFGDDRGSEAKLHGTKSAPPPDSESSRLADAEDGVGGTSLAKRLSSVLPPPPSHSTLGAHTAQTKVRVGAAAETVALRARLRERWFRLEASRKAQRQRESAERGRMAAEDGNDIGGNESKGARTRRQRLVDPSGSVDDGDSAGSGRDSEDEDTSSCRDEIPDQERPQSAHSLSAFTIFPPQEIAVAGTPCPGSRSTALVSTRQGGTSGSAARGPNVLSQKPRAVSAAGVAAIKRSETAASTSAATTQPTGIGALVGPSMALSADEGTSRPNYSEKMNAAVVATDLEAAGPILDLHENDKADLGLSEGGVGSDSYSSDMSALPEDRVYAACKAGMAGLLNGLLVRSGGRVADGKDKVRG